MNLKIKPEIRWFKGLERKGPHNKDIISIIFGSLLANAHGEKGLLWEGTKFKFSQKGVHVTYILFIYKQLSELGYCNSNLPSFKIKLCSKGKLKRVVKFSTWSYWSFNWIYDLWYNNKIKHVPKCIEKYLTPLALAIWIMNNGAKIHGKFKINMYLFSYDDCLLIIKALNNNFNIKASIQSAGKKDQYMICICKESMINLKNIVSPYIIPEMKYKFN